MTTTTTTSITTTTASTTTNTTCKNCLDMIVLLWGKNGLNFKLINTNT